MTKESQLPEGTDTALTANQVAEIVNVSIFTVHEWLRSGSLRGFKLRAQWRVMRSDLDQFIREKRESQATPEAKAEAEPAT